MSNEPHSGVTNPDKAPFPDRIYEIDVAHLKKQVSGNGRRGMYTHNIVNTTTGETVAVVSTQQPYSALATLIRDTVCDSPGELFRTVSASDVAPVFTLREMFDEITVNLLPTAVDQAAKAAKALGAGDDVTRNVKRLIELTDVISASYSLINGEITVTPAIVMAVHARLTNATVTSSVTDTDVVV